MLGNQFCKSITISQWKETHFLEYPIFVVLAENAELIGYTAYFFAFANLWCNTFKGMVKGSHVITLHDSSFVLLVISIHCHFSGWVLFYREAEATRNALHGVHWPVGNGKQLLIDYATVEELRKAQNPSPLPPVLAPVQQENIVPVEHREPEVCPNTLL